VSTVSPSLYTESEPGPSLSLTVTPGAGHDDPAALTSEPNVDVE